MTIAGTPYVLLVALVAADRVGRWNTLWAAALGFMASAIGTALPLERIGRFWGERADGVR